MQCRAQLVLVQSGQDKVLAFHTQSSVQSNKGRLLNVPPTHMLLLILHSIEVHLVPHAASVGSHRASSTRSLSLLYFSPSLQNYRN